MNPERKNVLRVGSVTISSEPFSERGLDLVRVTLDQVSAAANSACAIIIAEQKGKLGLIQSDLTALVSFAEDYDLSLALIINSDKEFIVLNKIIRELGLEGRTTIRSPAEIRHAAEFIRNWDPGPQAGSPEFANAKVILDLRQEFLLARSFHDCDRIYLESLDGGRDAAGVFCVHAWLKNSIVGPRPLPFFIKFATPEKIRGERFNYQCYADFYIPFYLRPNIVPARCAQIKDLSCLVGNFVEDSVPLRSALRRSQSPGIIFSLFEISLRGFRSQSAGGPKPTMDEPLNSFIRERSRAVNVEGDIIHLSQSSFQLKSTPQEIEDRLCTAIGSVKRRFSPYHGDLHTGNVMVRGKDAILIDFSAVKKGPLTADPATLEVSLIFGTDKTDALAEFDGWKKVVDEFYHGVPIHEPPSLGIGPGPFAWLYRAVREIRHVLLGCDCKQEEAAEVLAAYLLRFARLPADKFEEDALSQLARLRQAYALVVAERIVDSLVSKKGTSVT